MSRLNNHFLGVTYVLDKQRSTLFSSM